MTDQERQILEDAQDQAFASSQQLYDPETSGIRPPPSIIDEETTIEGALFGLEFEKFPGDEAESFGGGFTETFTGACCNYEEDSCNVVTEAECEASGGDFKGNNVECDLTRAEPAALAACAMTPLINKSARIKAACGITELPATNQVYARQIARADLMRSMGLVENF
jgi:hypothetical protein